MSIKNNNIKTVLTILILTIIALLTALIGKGLLIISPYSRESDVIETTVAVENKKINKENKLISNTSHTQPHITATVASPSEADTTTSETTETSTYSTSLREESSGANTDFLPVRYRTVPLDDELQGYIIEQCAIHDVNPALAFAVIQVESSYNPDCISDGNYGLMQINKCNFGAYGLGDPLDPYENARVGVTMLGELLAKYDWNDAIMAYNMGEYGASQLWVQDTHDTDYTIKVNRAFLALVKEGEY